jgi:hypothetical protein
MTMAHSYQVISAVALLAAIVVGASLVAALAKQWVVARELARFAVLTSVALIPVGVIVLLVAFNVVADAAEKSSLLAGGISTAMNCFAVIVPAVLAGIPVWIVAGQRSQPKPEPEND